MKKLIMCAKAFILGMREFRLGFTTYFNSTSARRAYDTGREAMHRLTLRRYED